MLYSDDFSGLSAGFPPGDFDLPDLIARGIANDAVSSVVVNAGFRLVMYQDSEFGGTRSTTLGEGRYSVADFGGSGSRVGLANDDASSIRVFTTTDEQACIRCDAGSYQQSGQSSPCKSCGVGQYQDTAGQGSCKVCLSGQYQDSSSAQSCRTCGAGQYQDATGQSSCNDCGCTDAGATGDCDAERGWCWTQHPGACTMQAVGAVLYPYPGFSGLSADFSQGDFDLADLVAKGIENDAVSSVIVKPGFELVMYQDDKQSGGPTQCSHQFGINFCSDWCNTAGFWACDVNPTLPASDDRNTGSTDYTCDCTGCNGCPERAQSAVLGEGQYDVRNFGGPGSRVGLSDDVSSIAIRDVSLGVTLYGDSKLAGAAVNFAPGNYDLSDLTSKSIANDDVSSFVVHPGLQVVLYQDFHFTGAAAVVLSGSYVATDFAALGIQNDDVSSMQVQRVPGETQCPDFVLPSQAWTTASTLDGCSQGDEVPITGCTASSESESEYGDDYSCEKAYDHDGVQGALPGSEFATASEFGGWMQMNFAAESTIGSMSFQQRWAGIDWCTVITLQFSDSSTQVVQLQQIDSVVSYAISPPKATSSAKITFTTPRYPQGSQPPVGTWCQEASCVQGNTGVKEVQFFTDCAVVSYQTPLSEYPTTRDACKASGAIVDHAQEWLARATDYHLQAVVTNAAVIAHQLCMEERLLYLPCFSSSETHMATLSEIYGDACELADVLGKVNAAGDPYQPNEVKPLTYTMYELFFQLANADIQQIQQSVDVESSAQQVIQQYEIDAAATGADDAHWYSRQAQVSNDMASAYFASVQQLQTQIDSKQQALGIDQTSLITSLQSQVAEQHAALTSAMDQADKAAKKQLAKDVGKTLFSVILAVVAAPETAGLSLTAAAVQTAEFVGGNKDVQTAAKSLGMDAVTYGMEVHADQGCGHLNQQECDDLDAQIDAATAQLRNVRDCLESLDGLMRFNNLVLNEHATVTAADLPKVSLLRASLGQIDASVAVQVFANAATLGAVATDVTQLVALIQSKFDVVTNYYKAKLSSQDSAAQQTRFQHRADRAQALALQSQAHLAALGTYLDVQLRSKCFLLLQYLIQQTQAYEYMALATDHNIVQILQQLAAQKVTVQDYAQLLNDAHSKLTQKWERTLVAANNCGGETWSSTEFLFSDLAGNTFQDDGHLTVSIGIPEQVGYSHVTFQDVRVYILGVQVDAPVTITFIKRGVSKFLDETGKEWTFTHQDTNPAFNSGYEYRGTSCDITAWPAHGASGSLFCADMHSVYMKYSPYGVWDVQVDDRSLDFSAATGIRFAFKLATSTSLATYTSGPRYIFRVGQTESEIAANNQCGGGSALASRPPPPPTPAGSHSPCANVAELTAYTQTVNSACCVGKKSCVNGFTSSCSQACAVVLLPMQSACASFLSQGGTAFASLNTLIDTAAASCPQSPNDCTTVDECNAYAARVTAECCDEPTESCASGIPKTCNAGCAAVLLPMQASCSDFLSGLIYRQLKSTIDAAAASCPGGGH